MKKFIKFTGVIMLAAMVFASCSKEKQLKGRLEGTWNIDRLDATISGTNIPFTNCGTYTFNSDGSGVSSITLIGTTPDVTNFTWTNTATTITTIETATATNPSPNKTPLVYTVKTNEKTKQEWTATETDNGVTSTGIFTLTKK